ncbi:Ribokinase-like protein [Phlegmacium glaucopus]|nr:Ribokinase-like protein [Phlegmacium glaucopus]
MTDRKCCCTVRGSINNDEYFYVRHIVRKGETISSHAQESRVGGKGANQAIAIVRAGGIVQFYGSIGKDGTGIRDSMMSYGIDVSGIIVSDEPTGRAIIQVDENGENSIILFPGANYSKMHETQFVRKSEDWFPETTHLLLQNEIHMQSTHYALQNAKNATVILNPSPLPSPGEIREFPWHKVDWLIVNEAEAEGLHLSMSEGTSSPMSTRDLLVLLSAQPVFKETNIVCTLGAGGVLAFIPTLHRPVAAHEAPSFIYLPAARLQGEIRDSTGAGDCFSGYFVQGLMECGPNAVVGKDIKERDITRILKMCVYAAGMSVEKPGTIDSIPTRAEVEERIASSSEAGCVD